MNEVTKHMHPQAPQETLRWRGWCRKLSGWDLDISYCGGQGRKQDWEGETGELCSELGTWALQNYPELWWQGHGFVLLDEPVSGCRLARWGNSIQLRQFPKKAERERLWNYSTVSCWIQTLESLRSQAQHRSWLQFSLEWENGRREEGWGPGQDDPEGRASPRKEWVSKSERYWSPQDVLRCGHTC